MLHPLQWLHWVHTWPSFFLPKHLYKRQIYNIIFFVSYEDVIWMLQSPHFHTIKVIIIVAPYCHFLSIFIINSDLELNKIITYVRAFYLSSCNPILPMQFINLFSSELLIQLCLHPCLQLFWYPGLINRLPPYRKFVFQIIDIWFIFPCLINMIVGNLNHIWKQKILFDDKFSNATTFL